MLTLDYRYSKRLRAALKLAAVYGAGVTPLWITLAIMSDPPPRVFDTLLLLSLPVGICFAIAFLLLAVARRAGFTALWLIVAGFWTWGVLQEFELFAIRGGFIFFTLFAAPLYAMCVLGFRREAATPVRWRQVLSVAIWPAWAALVGVALEPHGGHHALHVFEHRQYFGGWIWTLLRYAWLVTPPAITAAGLLRVYSRGPVDTTSPVS